MGKYRKRGRIYSTTPGYVTPLWSRSSQLLRSQLLLVGRGVIAQVPSNNNNTTTRNTQQQYHQQKKTPSQKKFVAFNIKQQRKVFLELN
jgi:hypothetical protein